MREDEMKEFELPKDAIQVTGITADHVWYETDRLINDMSMWQSRFKRLSETMEARHKEHLQIISNLMQEIRNLKEELKCKE